MSIFDYHPDIPKPRKPIKAERRNIKLAPANSAGSDSFRWLHQKTNYLMEMMKFFPDFENLGYANRTEDDADAATMWDQYGIVADHENAAVNRYEIIDRVSWLAALGSAEARNIIDEIFYNDDKGLLFFKIDLNDWVTEKRITAEENTELCENLNELYSEKFAEKENLPGYFGNIERDLKASGVPYGYGCADKYEEIHFTPNAGDFNHIDSEKGEFSTAGLFDPTETTLADISAGRWAEVKNLLSGENRSYYEIAMDNEGNLPDCSNKEAYLLMIGMLESRTRVWLTMEELFGAFNETDDQKRIAIIDAWVSDIENDLNPENITLLSLFLDSQESFINRISAFYGAGADKYLSYEDKQRIPNFFENLKIKVATYREELQAAGADAEVAELDKLWGLWIAPSEDTEAYPNYKTYDWATTPGNVLLAEENPDESSRQVVEQLKGLLPAEYKGLREVEVKMLRANGDVFAGNPYDHIWGTHIRGIFAGLIDKYVGQALAISITNRRSSKRYKVEKEKYEQEIWDKLMWEKAQKKAESKRHQERIKRENKVKASTKKQQAKLKKMMAQALAKRKVQKKSQARRMKAKMKIHGKQASKRLLKMVGKSLSASKKGSKKMSAKALSRRKQALKRIFGQADKKSAAARRKTNKTFSSRQKTQAAKKRSVQSQKSNRSRSRLVQSSKKASKQRSNSMKKKKARNKD